ncbi:hypothetical protein GGR53DRAFT_480199 [Hypoxylon sp. FL1150]|nr:hypothetical protein GGR53DRAFT_480199 [Hypoxylon sp. FL1150]
MKHPLLLPRPCQRTLPSSGPPQPTSSEAPRLASDPQTAAPGSGPAKATLLVSAARKPRGQTQTAKPTTQVTPTTQFPIVPITRCRRDVRPSDSRLFGPTMSGLLRFPSSHLLPDAGSVTVATELHSQHAAKLSPSFRQRQASAQTRAREADRHTTIPFPPGRPSTYNTPATPTPATPASTLSNSTDRKSRTSPKSTPTPTSAPSRSGRPRTTARSPPPDASPRQKHTSSPPGDSSSSDVWTTTDSPRASPPSKRART